MLSLSKHGAGFFSSLLGLLSTITVTYPRGPLSLRADPVPSFGLLDTKGSSSLDARTARGAAPG